MENFDIDALKAQLRAHEGWKNKPYRDTVGKLTIGCGRCLDDVGLRDREIDYLLEQDILVAAEGLDRIFPRWRSLTATRQRVMLDMEFNMGPTRLAGFKNMLNCITVGDYAGAQTEMLNSKWAQQVGQRAVTLGLMMAEG